MAFLTFVWQVFCWLVYFYFLKRRILIKDRYLALNLAEVAALLSLFMSDRVWLRAESAVV